MNQLLNPDPSAPAGDLRRPMTHPMVQAVTADLAARSRLLREHYLAGVRSRAGGTRPDPGPASVALIDVHGDPAATQLARDRIRLGGAIARSFGGGPVPCSVTEHDRGRSDGPGRDIAVMTTALALLTTPSTGAPLLASADRDPAIVLGCGLATAASAATT